MKTAITLLAAGAFLLTVGCQGKKDPRDRPGFVDTSDPGKVKGTMTPVPKKGPSGGSAGAGPPPKQ